MDEQEPREKFEATDYDADGNIQLPPPPIEEAKAKRPTMAGLKKQLEELEELVENDVFAWMTRLDTRLSRLEITEDNDKTTPATDITARLDNQDAAIGALADALRQHLEEPAATQPAPDPEIVFAPPPIVPEQVTVTKGDIEQVASVCNSMGDVLMICRALKAARDITDEDRLYVLQVACGAAGVPITGGLQIRAGIKYMAV